MFVMSAVMIKLGGSLAAGLKYYVPSKLIGTVSGLLLLALGTQVAVKYMYLYYYYLLYIIYSMILNPVLTSSGSDVLSLFGFALVIRSLIIHRKRD